jgi:hypothetical protein
MGEVASTHHLRGVESSQFGIARNPAELMEAMEALDYSLFDRRKRSTVRLRKHKGTNLNASQLSKPAT